MTNNNTEDYLREIRTLPGLKNAILSGVTVTKRDMTADFALITDKAYTKEEEERAREITARYLPPAFRAKVSISKRVPDRELLIRRIYDYVSKNFPAAAAFLKETDIEVEMPKNGGSGANFCFDIASGEQSLFSSGGILDAVSAFLGRMYCGGFYGNVRIVEKEAEALPEEDYSEIEDEYVPVIRRFPVTDFRRIDGADEVPKTATYIADCEGENDNLTVCGSISFIQEREYVRRNEKTGEDEQRSRFSLTVSDGTGSLRATYFPKKATVDKIRTLKTGDWVVLSGGNEAFNGGISYTARRINYGRPPENFVPEPREGRPVPAAYRTVFPEPYADCMQTGLFDSYDLPDDLKNNDFVVFDLETTGLNNQPSAGRMDRIIELGAVKLKNGGITEKFSTFVACPDKLPPEIVELTGIHDEDLKGAPEVDKVMADFYRFCDGCFLVGHNVQFDYRFVRYYGEKSRYMFDQKQYDTLTLSQELLRGEITNHKLNTVADHFGFTFNHHRAFDDALTTAKIFIELIKKRKTLP